MNVKFLEEIEQQINDSITAKNSLFQQIDKLQNIAQRLTSTFFQGKRLWLFGNGGSAADAQHLAAELAGKLYLEREPLPAVALTTNSSVLTAIGNDYSYEDIFARQVQGLVRQGDVVIAFSTSGNSQNVLAALVLAKKLGAWTVAFTGRGGKIIELADEAITIPSEDTPRIQETHITASHIICALVENLLSEGEEK